MSISIRSLVALPLVSFVVFVASSASADEAPSRPAVKVHVAGSTNTQLETKTDGAWIGACDAPCDEALAAGTYRISGPGVVASRPFRLAAKDASDVTLKVNAGRVGGLVGGIVLVSTGVTLLPVGALLFVATAGARGSAGGALFAAGVGTLALGIGGIVLGSLLIAGNAHTYVEQRRPTPKATDDSEARLRVPTFRESTAEEAAWSSPWVTPVVGGTF